MRWSLAAPVSRMLRRANYVGAHRNAPFVAKGGGWNALSIRSFRIFGSSTPEYEVVAMWRGDTATGCVSTVLKDTVDVETIDQSCNSTVCVYWNAART